MKNLLLKNATIILSDKIVEDAALSIDNAHIAQILANSENLKIKNLRADEEINLNGCKLFAGFIDIHNHGAVGVDVNMATAADLHKVSRFLATKGVTSWLPTLVPDSPENYQTAIDAIDELMKSQDEREPAAKILGVHYEGVFANKKMCGALRPKFFKTFKNGDEISEMPKLKTQNAIHLTTLAPEIEGGIKLIKELKKQNWIISIGHTRADSETLEKAFDAGATHVTHLFNAMTGVHHREIGVAGWALTKNEISCEIIADGVHVAPQMLAFAYKNKGAKNLALVSDSVAPTGLGDGIFNLWSEEISVTNGKTQNARGSIAGSVITMLDAVKMMSTLRINYKEISEMASHTPARVLGIDKDYGSIEIGKRADLVAIDKRGNVKLTIVGGRIAFTNM